MATVSRGSKSAGGTDFVDDTSILASEVNTDLNTLYTLVNGNIDSDNISSSANIPNSALAEIDGTKVADHADDDATYETTTTPGTTASLSRPTNLEESEERLRYRIEANRGYGGTIKYYDSGAAALADAAWVEPSISGPNLLVNSGFEGVLAASGDPPYGWTENGTLTASSIAAATGDADGADARHFTMTGGTSVGITQTVGGIKASTKYVFGVTYVRTSGTIAFQTSGGLGGGVDYSNPQFTDSSTTSRQTINLIVQSDTSGSDITVAILSTAASMDIDLIESWFYEIDDAKHAGVPTGLMQTASASTEVVNIPATVNSSTDWASNWTDVSTLALAQYIPGPGYRLIYEVDLTWAGTLNDTQLFYGFRLEEDNGSTSVVDGPFIEVYDNHGVAESNLASVCRMSYVVDNPTPGLTYTYTPQVTAADSQSGTGSAPRLHPLIAVTQGGGASTDSNSTIQAVSRARLRLERI